MRRANASTSDFRALSYPVRIFSGVDALEALPRELDRLGSRRAFVVSGRTVSRTTPLVSRIGELIGHRLAGVYDAAERNATRSSVEAATAAARVARCDCIVAVGAGSVLMVGRLMAILLAEDRPADELATRYDAGGAPVSPRLVAHKLPIINVLTAPTNAQNRGGSAMLDTATGRRMEFFDPKTRPASIFWDRDALMTAPPPLALANGLTVFWWSLMWVGAEANANVLVKGDRLHAFRLAMDSLGRMNQAEARIALCAASYLQNRDEDMGGRPFEAHWVSRVCYALGAGIVTVADQASPIDAYLALTGPTIGRYGHRSKGELKRMAELLAWPYGAEPSDGIATFREKLDKMLADLAGPRRLRTLLSTKDDFVPIVDVAVNSYNADPSRELARERTGLMAVLDDAW